jgi:DNA-binding response OmpR family regulator
MEPVKKQTILCVDDDKKNLELLEAVLLPHGYDLHFSESGEDALKQIDREIPDLILLDVMMPGMSGLDVLERLRAKERTRLIPVVLLTALNAEQGRLGGLEAGCDEFISKPFDMIELIVRVRSLLRISDYRKSLDEKEKLWLAIDEMSQPLILCRPDWVIANLNRAAHRFLMPCTEFKDFNFLDFIFNRYSVSVPRGVLVEVANAPKKFRLGKKDSERFATQCAEVSLEVSKNAAQEVEKIVLTLREIDG